MPQRPAYCRSKHQGLSIVVTPPILVRACARRSSAAPRRQHDVLAASTTSDEVLQLESSDSEGDNLSDLMDAIVANVFGAEDENDSDHSYEWVI